MLPRPFALWQRICEALGTVFGIVLVVVVTYQIIARYSPVPLAAWTEESARFTFIWATALIAGPAYVRAAYVGIDIVPVMLSDRVYTWWMRALHLGVLVFSLVLTWMGVQLGLRTLNQMSPGLGLPMGYVNGAMGFAGLNLSIMAFAALIGPQTRHQIGESLETAEVFHHRHAGEPDR
jgi:TRAP-type C4-dicarboxylate transport system permease small subunit